MGSGVALEVDKTVRTAALMADQAVVMATPVDEGRARANWVVALDAPARDTVDPYVPGTAGSTGAANAQAAMAQGAAVISQYDGDINSAIVISNNLPYIGDLNDGSSAQAPAGFVEKAVQSAANVARNAKVLR